MKNFYISSQFVFLTIAMILTVFNVKYRFFSNKELPFTLAYNIYTHIYIYHIF